MEIWQNTIDLFLDGEIWKDIEEYNGEYQVSNLGRIKSFKQYKKGKILDLSERNKYLRIGLCKNGKRTTKHINILVYETFHEYKLNKNEIIHHKDKNKKNNYIFNLEKMIKFNHLSLHNKGKILSIKTKNKISKNHADFNGEKNPNYRGEK